MESINIDLILLSISWNTTIKSGCKYRLSFFPFFNLTLIVSAYVISGYSSFFFHSFRFTLLDFFFFFFVKTVFSIRFYFLSSIPIGLTFRKMCTYWFPVKPECVRAFHTLFFFLRHFFINVCNHKTVKNSPESDKWNTFRNVGT